MIQFIWISVRVSMCEGVCVESERELQYSLLMPNSCFSSSSPSPLSPSLPCFLHVSLSLPLLCPSSLSQAMTGSWEMMSADFSTALSVLPLTLKESTSTAKTRERWRNQGKERDSRKTKQRAETKPKLVLLIIPSASCSNSIPWDSSGWHFPLGGSYSICLCPPS